MWGSPSPDEHSSWSTVYCFTLLWRCPPSSSPGCHTDHLHWTTNTQCTQWRENAERNENSSHVLFRLLCILDLNCLKTANTHSRFLALRTHVSLNGQWPETDCRDHDCTALLACGLFRGSIAPGGHRGRQWTVLNTLSFSSKCWCTLKPKLLAAYTETGLFYQSGQAW